MFLTVRRQHDRPLTAPTLPNCRQSTPLRVDHIYLILAKTQFIHRTLLVRVYKTCARVDSRRPSPIVTERRGIGGRSPSSSSVSFADRSLCQSNGAFRMWYTVFFPHGNTGVTIFVKVQWNSFQKRLSVRNFQAPGLSRNSWFNNKTYTLAHWVNGSRSRRMVFVKGRISSGFIVCSLIRETIKVKFAAHLDVWRRWRVQIWRFCVSVWWQRRN